MKVSSILRPCGSNAFNAYKAAVSGSEITWRAAPALMPACSAQSRVFAWAMSDHTAGTVICSNERWIITCSARIAQITYDVFNWNRAQCAFWNLVTKGFLKVFAKSGHEIGHELFGVVRWRKCQRIDVFCGQTRITGLRRVKGQFESLMSLFGIFDLIAPFVIVAIVGDLAMQCKRESPGLSTSWYSRRHLEVGFFRSGIRSLSDLNSSARLSQVSKLEASLLWNLRRVRHESEPMLYPRRWCHYEIVSI